MKKFFKKLINFIDFGKTDRYINDMRCNAARYSRFLLVIGLLHCVTISHDGTYTVDKSGCVEIN